MHRIERLKLLLGILTPPVILCGTGFTLASLATGQAARTAQQQTRYDEDTRRAGEDLRRHREAFEQKLQRNAADPWQQERTK